MTLFECLKEMRDHGGKARTSGLADEVISKFADLDPQLLHQQLGPGVEGGFSQLDITHI